MYFTPANPAIPVQLNWVTASYPICLSLIDSFTELCWVAPAWPHLIINVASFSEQSPNHKCFAAYISAALCNFSLSIFTAMKCDYKSSWKGNEWNLEDSSGNGRRFPESDFWFCSSLILHIWNTFHYLSEMMWLHSFKLEKLHRGKECHICWCHIHAVIFEACWLPYRMSCLHKLVFIWVNLGVPYTHEETCVAVKLIKYHLFNAVGLNIFWYMNSKFSSGGASFHAVNVRLLPTGFFISPFADPLRRSIRIVRNLCITGWKNIDLW